ncbi:Calcineurin-like phosphoesterase [Formosa sp. Hel1_31_208]|uniref:metallophosphoesterase family protein n=1 Tax=Formosa sp. Hel1_31_208 TaxID=1798225 RepID=UPI00087DC489|nr:metallophosphoesterase [Formosa sp. Hel1_31_208]SDR75119.1 Calcineurin-like phosphoesterase [Formosa sp. Hel1_31_208]
MKLRILVIAFVCLFGCSKTEGVKHSFFVAGHTYGDPNNKGKDKGLYQPFKDKFGFINEQKKIKFGVLLGDVVWKPNAWPEAQEDISKLKMPIYIARGNHDGPLKAFESKFGKSYQSFIQNDALFIILDPNIDQWNISNEQLIFLKNKLRIEGKKVKNIFIFTHQVLWWSKEKFAKPKPNSIQNRASKTNFWTKIEPLLSSTNKPVFLFAGDVGAFSKEHRKKDHITEYSYFTEGNITYITSGMGGGIRDNFVIVDIHNNGEVTFRLIHLNGEDKFGLGNLEDYNNPNK